MAEDLELSLGEARRLAVRCQFLAGPAPEAGIGGLRQVLRGMRVLQIDPVNVVARSHLLVLATSHSRAYVPAGYARIIALWIG